MKIYLHLEGSDVNFTTACSVSDDTSVQDLLDNFTLNINDSNTMTQRISAVELLLKDGDGKVLNSTKKRLVNILGPNEDLFVTLVPRPVCAAEQSLRDTPIELSSPTVADIVECAVDVEMESPSMAGTSVLESTEEECRAGPSKSAKAKAKARAKAKAKASKGTISPEQMAALKAFVAEKSYKKARHLAELVLSTVSGTDVFALRMLADILNKSRHYQRSVDVCQQGLQVSPQSLQLHYIMGKSLMGLKQFTRASTAFNFAIMITQSSAGTDISVRAQDDSDISGSGSNGTAQKDLEFELELVALRAECIFESGHHNEAVASINAVPSNRTAAANNVPILIAYSYFAMRYSKVEEPGRALLKAVILGESARVKRMLAELMSSPQGMAQILLQMPPPPDPKAHDRIGKSEVYAFLGYVAKTHSVIPVSIRCYEISLRLQPYLANCALNLMHMYEITGDYVSAMLVFSSFCAQNPELGLGLDPSCNSSSNSASSEVASVRCRDMLRAIAPPRSSASAPVAPNTTTISSSSSSSSATEAPVRYGLTWVQMEEMYGYLLVTPLRTKKVKATATAAEEPADDFTTDVAPDSPTEESSGDGCSYFIVDPWTKYRYSNAELDLLALFATAAKVLFLQGRLRALPAVYRLLEPCRVQTEKPLHETTIRNEMAYFQEIAQMLCFRNGNSSYGLKEEAAEDRRGPVSSAASAPSAAFHPLSDVVGFSGPATAAGLSEMPPLLRKAAAHPLYLLGDSHTVPAAWSIVRVRGQPRLLVPKLVTGVKQWHLRADSDFYPKAHFHNMVSTIPDGAEVNVNDFYCRDIAHLF